jgi:hypothetical protein
LSSFRSHIIAIEVEAFIGLWLISGAYPLIAQLVTFALFASLGAMSFYMALKGESSCGCWGRIQVSPWITLAVDLLALAGIGSSFFRKAPFEQSLTWRRSPVKPLAGAVAILVVVSGVFISSVNDPWSQLARLRGDFITVEPALCELGSGYRGERRKFAVNLVNHGDLPVNFVGGTTDCGCIATDDLPIVLAPGESRTIHVRMVFKGSKGVFQRRYVLYTDEERQKFVVARIKGEVAEQPEIAREIRTTDHSQPADDAAGK